MVGQIWRVWVRVGPTARKALNAIPKRSLSMVALFTERIEAVSSAQENSFLRSSDAFAFMFGILFSGPEDSVV